ncbi:porin family protein [Rufibacter roseus]|uniref:Porin family protein n=1 Tax=Rufibacter roseus TaxID=1567108 RepID=A0ABW2DHV9_9BACT|nr:porin family protein [Rufibacter roseus]
MKKLLFLFAAVVVSYTTQAQATFGLKGGLNYSNLSGDLKDEERFNNKIGYNAGIFLNAPIVGDFFSIQPEVLYSNKGYRYDDKVVSTVQTPVVGAGEEYRYEGSANFNYIDVPVLARVKAGPIFFEAGPQVSYLVSVNDKTKQYNNRTGELITRNTSEKSKEGYSDFEVGYAAGIGFATQGGISLGLRYTGAFTELTDDSPTRGDFKNARHSVFQLQVGFPISR